MANTKTTKTAEKIFARAVADSFTSYEQNYGVAWNMGTNWNSIDYPEFRTYLYNELFPKLNETRLVNIPLGNRFQWIGNEVEHIGQFSEEYVFMDIVPVAMKLTEDETLMLRRNYPKIATKLYREGLQKKMKFTLNDNAARLKWLTLGDAVSFAVGLVKHCYSQINISEESEIKALLTDYSLNYTKDKRQVNSMQEMFETVYESILDLQENSPDFNETHLASGGALGRKTTVTKIEDILVLTTNEAKRYLLDTKIANTFQIAGMDLTKQITSFKNLGGVYKATADFQISDQLSIDYMRSYGDYQSKVGDYIRKDEVFTYDVSQLTDFSANVVEVKPDGDLYSYIVDINKVRYNTYTKNMLASFTNHEFEESNHWMHYYSEKRMSPFFNNILVHGSTT